MKAASYLLIAASLVFPIFSAHTAEFFTLVAEKTATTAGNSNAITLAAGDTAELKFASFRPTSGNSPLHSRLIVTSGTSSFEIGTSIEAAYNTSGTSYTLNPFKIAGPASISFRLGWDGGGYGVSPDKQFATIEVNRAGTASNAAAIPQEAGTVWQVILEASTDLVNWTPVPPGDYPAASPQRFFRTRLVKRS